MNSPQCRWWSKAAFLFPLTLTIMISTSAASNTAMSREEQIVRMAYAKLAFAAQVTEVHKMIDEHPFKPEEIDRNEFTRRLHDAEVTFSISNMKVGNIEEILNTKYSELATKPSGDVLSSTHGIYIYTREGKEVRSETIHLEWIKGQQNFIEDWDTPLGEGLRINREQKTNLSTYTRYARYSITTTFKQKSRSYLAMFLFGTKPDGTEDILVLDLILNVNGSGLNNFRKESAYPEVLLHEHHNVGAIAEWLQSNQVESPGGKHEVECDLVKLKCGVASGDLRQEKLRHKPISALQRLI